MVRHARDILMISDDQDAAGRLCQALHEDIRSFDVVASAEEGVALLQQAAYRLLLLDLTAPQMGCFEALHIVRAQPTLRPPAIVAICGAGQRSQILGVMEAGADDFISKPYDTHDLAIRIAAWLARVGSATSQGRCGLRVYSLGRFSVERDGKRLLHESGRARKVNALFKYLLTHQERAVSTAEVIGHFWPDAPEQVAATDLRSLLYQLRRLLRLPTQGSSSLQHTPSTITLRLSADDWWDVREFTAWLDEAKRWQRAGQVDQALEAYAAAAGLYQGDYLHDDAYAVWLRPARDRLREEWVRALEAMAALHGLREEHESQERVLRDVLHADPYREHSLRALMQTLIAQGRSAEALVVYRGFEALMQTEFDAVPDAETQAVIARIKQHAR